MYINTGYGTIFPNSGTYLVDIMRIKIPLFKVVRQMRSHSYEHIYISGYFCALTYLENGQ